MDRRSTGAWRAFRGMRHYIGSAFRLRARWQRSHLGDLGLAAAPVARARGAAEGRFRAQRPDFGQTMRQGCPVDRVHPSVRSRPGLIHIAGAGIGVAEQIMHPCRIVWPKTGAVVPRAPLRGPRRRGCALLGVAEGQPSGAGRSRVPRLRGFPLTAALARAILLCPAARRFRPARRTFTTVEPRSHRFRCRRPFTWSRRAAHFGGDWFRHGRFNVRSRSWSPRHVKQGYCQN